MVLKRGCEAKDDAEDDVVWGLRTRSWGLLEKDRVGEGLGPGEFDVSCRHVSSEWSSKTLR